MTLFDVYQTSKKYGWVKSRFSKFPYPQKFYINDHLSYTLDKMGLFINVG